jgi:hypothetical protein
LIYKKTTHTQKLNLHSYVLILIRQGVLDTTLCDKVCQ